MLRIAYFICSACVNLSGDRSPFNFVNVLLEVIPNSCWRKKIKPYNVKASKKPISVARIRLYSDQLLVCRNRLIYAPVYFRNLPPSTPITSTAAAAHYYGGFFLLLPPPQRRLLVAAVAARYCRSCPPPQRLLNTTNALHGVGLYFSSLGPGQSEIAGGL